MSQTQNNLLGLPQSELQEFFQGIEEKNYRAKQLMQWIYAKGVYDFNLMTNFNFNLREYLNENCTLGFDNSNRTDFSKDGTVKWLIEKQDQQIKKITNILNLLIKILKKEEEKVNLDH